MTVFQNFFQPSSPTHPHAIGLVKEAIKQLLPLVSSSVVAAANLNVRPDLLHELENYNHERDHIDEHHTALGGKFGRRQLTLRSRCWCMMLHHWRYASSMIWSCTITGGEGNFL
jgi:hypothetical protein